MIKFDEKEKKHAISHISIGYVILLEGLYHPDRLCRGVACDARSGN
jgi:hypothetical protein